MAGASPRTAAGADRAPVAGHPLADVRLLEDPAKNVRLIMKDGKLYKQTL